MSIGTILPVAVFVKVVVITTTFTRVYTVAVATIFPGCDEEVERVEFMLAEWESALCLRRRARLAEGACSASAVRRGPGRETALPAWHRGREWPGRALAGLGRSVGSDSRDGLPRRVYVRGTPPPPEASGCGTGCSCRAT